MNCASCNAPLESRMSFCPNCGTITPYSSAYNRSSTDGATERADPQISEAISTVQTSQLEQPQPVRAPQSQMPAPVSSFQREYAGQPGTSSASTMAPVTYQPQQGQQAQARQRGLSRGKAALLAGLALLAMLGGFSLILYSAVIHPAQLQAQATATAIAVFNAQASQTAQANAQASATAIAIANATATAQAVATARAVATATALQNIYTQGTRGTPVFDDPLTYNANNWAIGSANGGGGCFFTGGAYHSSVQQKGYYLPCIAQNTNFSNFAFQVTLTILSGDEGGMVFRANDANSQGYLFSIKRDGSFGIFLTTDNAHSTTLDFGSSSAIHAGLNKPNTLTAVARGSQIYLYVNKHYLTNVASTAYTSGQIGVFSAEDAAPTDIAFSKAQVWQL